MPSRRGVPDLRSDARTAELLRPPIATRPKVTRLSRRPERTRLARHRSRRPRPLHAHGYAQPASVGGVVKNETRSVSRDPTTRLALHSRARGAEPGHHMSLGCRGRRHHSDTASSLHQLAQPHRRSSRSCEARGEQSCDSELPAPPRYGGMDTGRGQSLTDEVAAGPARWHLTALRAMEHLGNALCGRPTAGGCR